MSKSARPQININLSSKGQKTVGKVFYKWAIDAGRAIIVIIELIALGALGYRFVIDRKIVDLHDAIKQQEAFVAAQASEEKIYRAVQDRLKNIKLTSEETTNKITIMDEVLKAVSTGTFFSTNLTINQKSIHIDGTTFSIFTLTTFVDSLKKFPKVSSISIDEINTTDDGVRFKVRIEMSQQPKAS